MENSKITTIPLQETTSTYFNSIVNRDTAPVSVLDFDTEKIRIFQSNVRIAFPDEADVVNRRLHYLIPYIMQTIDWKEYGSELQPWQLKYYYQRERFLERTGLRYEDFLRHPVLLRSVEELGLEAEPVFEFILFLKYYFNLRGDLRFSAVEQLVKLKEALSRQESNARMDVTVNGKHFKFENSQFIKQIFEAIDPETFTAGAFRDNFDEGRQREKLRALDYYLVKTLLDYLPVRSRSQRGLYSQAERNFALSVLNFCGRLVGDMPEILCTHFNNVTFDKLMRDFRGVKIPFAMELFL